MSSGAEIAKTSLGAASQVAGMVPGIGTAISAGLGLVTSLIDPFKALVEKGRERRNPTPKNQQEGTMVNTEPQQNQVGGAAAPAGPMQGQVAAGNVQSAAPPPTGGASQQVGGSLDSAVANYIIGNQDRSFYG